jgi:integrase
MKIIQPAARKAGIKKRVSWHTFRHSYSSLLVANGEKVKVVQELMRHASSRFTLDVYAHDTEGGEETSPAAASPDDPARRIQRCDSSDLAGKRSKQCRVIGIFITGSRNGSAIL